MVAGVMACKSLKRNARFTCYSNINLKESSLNTVCVFMGDLLKRKNK